MDGEDGDERPDDPVENPVGDFDLFGSMTADCRSMIIKIIVRIIICNYEIIFGRENFDLS